jgi:hypothetical protein
MKKYMALGAVVAALGAGAAAAGQMAAAGGKAAARQDQSGLSMTPVIVERQASAGPIATYTIANRSSAPLAITVTPRPWAQAPNGKVSPDRRKTLNANVSVSEPRFDLAPGEVKNVAVNLTSVPSSGSLYGALEIVGLPQDAATRKGVVLGYRLVGAIRMTPASPTTGLKVGNPKAAGRTATISVKNTGNTIDPVSVSLRVKGATGTRTPTVPALRILPGNTVQIPVGNKLQRGTYTVTLQLSQRGKRVTKYTKKLRVK